MTLEFLYEQMLLEGQLQPRPEEQEAYDRLVAINNKAGIRDFTDALLQWYRSELKQNNEDISFDKTNHIRDTLSILNKVLSNGTLKPGTEVSIETPNGIQKKDISNPRSFFRFDAFEGALRNYLNQQVSNEGEQYLQQTDLSKAQISLYKVTPDLVVFATKGYEDTLAFIRVLWPKMQGTSNLGAHGSNAYNNDICPYCTSGKSHWNDYSSGKNYTQYWFLKNIGTNLQDYYGKGKETLYAMLDSDGDLLDKYDTSFNQYAQHPHPSFVPLIKELYLKHKREMDEEDSVFNVLNAPNSEQIEEMRQAFFNGLKKNIDANGVHRGNINIPPNITSLVGMPQKVDGDFYCINNQLTSLEGAPQEVNGIFYCSNNQLTSLEGAPQKVGGNFYCSSNQLTSLEGAPQKVGGSFNCSDNQLTSLEGAPQKVNGYFDCSNNQLTSLEGAPQEVGEYFNCNDNQLTSLEGAPQKVNRSFNCSDNQLTSLEGAPQKVGGSFSCSDNQLTSLEGAPQEVGEYFNGSSNPVKFTNKDIKNAMQKSKLKASEQKKTKIKEDHILHFDKLINLYERYLQGGLAWKNLQNYYKVMVMFLI
jgi:hypothetical protein